MKFRFGIVVCLASLLSVPVTSQVVGTKQLTSRIELHPIQTLTLTIGQILNGQKGGAKPATVVGELRIAQGTGRLPVVVMLHGGGGVDARADSWSSQFNEMGISTFVLDGFTGRGIASSGVEQTLERLNLTVDAYRALNLLAKHPRVDPSRIALMGFSFGAHATLYASMKRFQRLWNESGVQIAAYVAFYPNCSVSYLDELDVDGRPIRILHGTPDDANPVAPCKAYVERLRGRAGRDVQLTEYPNAQHGFDNPLIPPATSQPEVQSMRRCAVSEQPRGRLVNTANGKAFTYDDPCVERGVHVGHDPVATREAHHAVGAFFKALFSLP